MGNRVGLRLGLALAGSLALIASAGCGDGDGGTDTGPPRPDTGPPRRDSGMAMDAGQPDDAGEPDDAGGDDAGDAAPPDAEPVDASFDAGPANCGTERCEPFQFCDMGVCRDYPACRTDNTCDRPTDVCQNPPRRCVPVDVDVDGDGFPAGEDCDETSADRFPGNTEICNNIDEDCDATVDEGDPAALCEFNPGGGECIGNECTCEPGEFDLDRTVPGCECTAIPPPTIAHTCADAIDLGSVTDTGGVQTITGNVLPDDRVVWYRFRGVDSPDTSCDNYNVRVRFTDNPDDTFEFTVYRGSCSATACADEGYTEYNWATDFRASVGGTAAGQCNCYASGATRRSGQSVCENDSADYYVRVRRRTGATLSCTGYVLEISNGFYDSPFAT